MKLSYAKAMQVVEKKIARPLGISVEDASLAVNALANAKIAEGIRAATVRRGLDPRDFTLFSFGGAGGVHADMVSRELFIPTTTIPRQASVLSALGFLTSDVRHDYSAPVGKTLSHLGVGELGAIFKKLEAEAKMLLATEEFVDDRVRIVRLVDCRYYRQVFSVGVRIDEEDLEQPDYGWLLKKFEASYRSLYHHIHADVPAYIDTCRIAAFGIQPPLILKELTPGGSDPSAALRRSRRIYLGSWSEAPVYWFDDLAEGMVIEGPAVVDSASTSVVIGFNSKGTVDRFGSIEITSGTDERRH
jgi:N-methylhydantoinase A